MVKKINKIHNLGRFENFSSSYEFGLNTIIFGFNGAGKSTLSDVFYSLSKPNTESYLARRRTLNREGDVGEKEIEVDIVSEDDEALTFSGGTWSKRPDDLYVFNEKYIEEHVFVSKCVEGDSVPIGIGPDGARLLRQREETVQSNNELLASINSDIEALVKANIKIKDFSQSKISQRTPRKRFEAMSNFPLYPLGSELKILEKLKQNEIYTQEIDTCDECDEMYLLIDNIEMISIAEVFKKVEKIPRISSKEIARFLEETLTSVDIKWAVRGYMNKKANNICPMCGQTIADRRAIAFFDKLGKFVSQGKNEQLSYFSKDLYAIASKLEDINISERIRIFVQIVERLNERKLLLKRDANRLRKGLSWTEQDSELITSLAHKIFMKAENPYIDVEVSVAEKETLKLLNSVIGNINVLGNILEDIRVRVEERCSRNINKEEAGKRYELSYGAEGMYRIIAERIKNNASIYCKNIDKIDRLSSEITDCYNQSRLEVVNDFLLKLNTQIKIEVKNNLHYIKLKDFQSKELDKKDGIFSEGENRAIAFAYYLAEISNDEIGTKKRTIVIDDPISSMDLSRKSMISHRIAEMMNIEDWQIILMTHDISFVERVISYLDYSTTCGLLEIRSGKDDFLPLNPSDYLTDDKQVYEKFIEDAVNSDDRVNKIIALMALRPYSYVLKADEDLYRRIEKKSTYFAHTLYSKSGRISFRKSDYANNKLLTYVRLVNKALKNKINPLKLIGDYDFEGFDFERITELYDLIPLDSMDNMRKKVMLMRPLIEACFFQLSSKAKFDPEHIGSMYNKTIRANKNDPRKYRMCVELKELYDASKKYHHGADEGSLLGISWVNPNEVEYFDRIIREIVHEMIDCAMVRKLSA